MNPHFPQKGILLCKQECRNSPQMAMAILLGRGKKCTLENKVSDRRLMDDGTSKKKRLMYSLQDMVVLPQINTALFGDLISKAKPLTFLITAIPFLSTPKFYFKPYRVRAPEIYAFCQLQIYYFPQKKCLWTEVKLLLLDGIRFSFTCPNLVLGV